MKLRLREPFYGEAVDAALLPEPALGALETAYEKAIYDQETANIEHFAEGCEMHMLLGDDKHPDYREIGTEIPLGFVPSQGENRRQRRAAVATWAPPVIPEGDAPPTRRELWAQRQRQRRGKLDPELRRIQRERQKTK